jgi:integrase
MHAKPRSGVKRVKKISWTREGVGYRVLADGKRSYCYRYRDADCKQRCHFLGPGSTEKEAIEKLAEVTLRKKRGEQVRPSRVTFAEYADRWLNSHIVGIDIQRSTYQTYRWNIEKRLKPYFGSRALQKIDKHDVASFIELLKRRGYRGWTIRAAVVPLSGIFRDAMDEGILSSNPVGKVSRRKREKPNADMQPKRILTLEEVNTLLSAAQRRGHRWHALLATFIYTGVRLGEALGLRWKDIDFDDGVVRVRKQADRDTGVLRAPKQNSLRDIPLATALRKVLLEWKLESRFVDPEDRLFTTVTRTPISHRNATARSRTSRLGQASTRNQSERTSQISTSTRFGTHSLQQ